MYLQQSVFVSRRILTPRQQYMKIICDVSDKQKVPVTEILGPLRHKYIMRARDEAIHRIRKELGYSTTKIGRIFGRDHSTVLTSLKRSISREILRSNPIG